MIALLKASNITEVRVSIDRFTAEVIDRQVEVVN
jgi:hypothetical protein